MERAKQRKSKSISTLRQLQLVGMYLEDYLGIVQHAPQRARTHATLPGIRTNTITSTAR